MGGWLAHGICRPCGYGLLFLDEAPCATGLWCRAETGPAIAPGAVGD